MFADRDHRRADVDPDADLTSHEPLIDHDTLVQWKVEIRDFFAATEQKLRRFQKPAESHELTESRSYDSSSELSPPSESPRERLDSAPAYDSAAEPPTAHHEAQDGSLDRLQIIKNRLAAQLENSRR